ncbi:MAG: DUF1549 and DUF1553 domain-containing protein [Planctomycetota bacterium]|nr:DUF1549 and DUF1553 domain-containing protein [Planctomycetota bacterium]MDA1214196.1 DUF1549 and DUF1553 domain-containing protein [Planctomycetota bacterium]
MPLSIAIAAILSVCASDGNVAAEDVASWFEYLDEKPALSFEHDIEPIFVRFGCNSSGCHGKAEGQNGFKLSVFSYDAPSDFKAVTQEGRGRRVFPARPQSSLLLEKASGGVPHGGGIRIRKGSGEYRVVRRWIEQGMPFGSPDDPQVVELQVEPHEQTVELGTEISLRVLAKFSDGRLIDVTQLAKFQSNQDAIALVDEFGRVTIGDTPGQVTVMASYMGQVDQFRALIPRQPAVENYPEIPSFSPLDDLVVQQLKRLNIVPSDVCTDAEYLRRVYLDIIGTMPTTAEAREFLADTSPNKRALLVERLLDRPEYADYWAMKWADWLKVNRTVLGHKGSYNFVNWIRQSFAAHKSYDAFARDLLLAEGPLTESPGGHFFKTSKDAGEMASTVSQVFLGVRIECARCHHHPFDRWAESDYYGMQALFAQVGFKPITGGEMIGALSNPATSHPRTGERVFAHPLDTLMPAESPEGDRRKILVEWMTSNENAWFARNFVNKMWAHFLGQGIVEPVDDFRSTNPPSNPQLLDALADRFIAAGFDISSLIRDITATRTYQLSSHPNETNELDAQNYSRALFKRMDAEVLFDAVCQTTGVPEKFEGIPTGYRAIQLWDSQVPHYFLTLFGRPVRVTACTCERSVEPSVSQVLHVLNSPNLQQKLSHESGTVATLVKSIEDDDQLVQELYLTFYSRFPDADELQAVTEYLSQHAGERRQAVEDIAWSLLNSIEFVFNH